MVKRYILLFSAFVLIITAGCTSSGQIPSLPMAGSSTNTSTVSFRASSTSNTNAPLPQPGHNSVSSSTTLPTPSRTPAPVATQTTPEQTPTPAALPPTGEPASPTPTVNSVVTTTPVGQATQTEITTPTPLPATGTSACTDQATFEGDMTIPDNTIFHQGDSFVKTWKLYNSGTCAWGPGYELVLAYGDPMGASNSNPLPAASPGTSIDVSLNMTAPNGAGQHAGNWQLQNASGQRFGVGSTGSDYFWVQINVSYVSQEVTHSSEVQATPAGVQITTTATPTTTTTSDGCSYTRNPDFEDQVLQQINVVRAGNGLNPLTLNPQLSAAAFTYSLDMACSNRVDFVRHTDSNGGRWYDRIAAQGYSYAAAFENVYVGNPAYSGGTPESAMNWWMNSPIHRANILNPDITEIGIAYVFTSTSDYGGYYTTDFATPK